jgi:serine/threonine protein kinase
MSLPPTNGSGSTGKFPPEPVGSSIVNLLPVNPDDRPTIIVGPRATPAQPPLIAGQKLGHFELLDTIGRGGMATVLKARDLELGRIVALKILPPETTRDSESVLRFKQEARAAAKLDHDRIARVYFCGEDRGLHFIAFEFVGGDNLRTVIDRDGPLAPADAVRYLLDVAGGLKHAAERGVVHRDIKPSNILIAPDGHAKIVDMGLARHFEPGGVNGGVTQSGVTLGTFDYISPEQALDPRRADLRSDIYSLGCSFYHALTGRPPVPDGTAAVKFQAHQHDAPIDPRDLNPAVPESLAAVLAKMMAKNPDRRYSTADELIADLQAVATACGYTLDAPPPESATLRPAPTLAEPPARLPLAWLLAGSAAVIALAILFGRGSNGNGPTTPPWGEIASTSKAPALENAATPAASIDTATKPILTVAPLIEALKSSDAVALKLQPGYTYDLSTIVEGTTFTGASLMLEADASGSPNASPPILRVAAASLGDDPSPRPGTLTCRNCKQVTLRGVEIRVVDSANSAEANADIPIAVLMVNVGKVNLNGCRFHGESASPMQPAIGLAIHSDAPADVNIRHSLFDVGPHGIAVQVEGPIRGEFEETAFAPHEAAIAVAGVNRDVAASELKLSQCTFLLDLGAAIRAQAGAAAQISAGFCLFAAGPPKSADEVIMPGTEVKPPKAIVLRVDDETPAVRFTPSANHPNGYYRVTPLLLGDKASNFADSPAAVFADPTARILARSPWAVGDPRPLVNGSDPPSAFRLTLNDARLRLPPATAAVILGAKALGSAESRIYPGAWPPERALAVKAASNERIVWPEAEPEDAAARLYPSFVAAFAALQPGETLSLAVNGPVPVPLLAEKSLRATIRAAAGFKPMLVPEGPGFTTDATLFRVAEGDLAFENLEIRLKDRQAIVAVAGKASCAFRHCVLTLGARVDGPVAAAVIPAASREMRTSPGPEDPPRVQFTDTILRGVGRAVWVQAARSFDAGFDNCAVALDGNLLVLDAPEKTVGETPKGRLRLKNSTLVLDDPLFEVKAGRSSGNTPAFVNVEADACLFAAADSRSTATPMLLLDDAETMADPAKYLAWSGRGSVYGFPESDAAVEWRTGEVLTTGWDWPQWLRFARDDGKHVPRLRFARGSLKAKLAIVEAADFALSVANPLDAGANLERLAGDAKNEKP